MNEYFRSLLRKPYYKFQNIKKKLEEFYYCLILFFFRKKIIMEISNSKINFFDIGSLNGLIDLKVKKYNFMFDFFGFDPNNGSYTGYKKIFNNIIDKDSGKKKFYITRIPDLSSTLKPNIKFQENYHDLKKFEIIQERELNADTVDNISIKNNILVDFLKIDTQGTALSVLKGSEKNLKNSVIGLEIEVEFQETYTDQDTYIEICDYLNKLNFEVLDILDLSRWEYKNSLFYGDPRERSCGRLVYSNFLFLKKLDHIHNLISEKKTNENKKSYLKKILNILLAYEKPDSVKFLFEKYSYLLSSDEIKCYKIFSKAISFKKRKKNFVR